MVKISKLKFTILQQDVLRLLYIKAGETLNARQISKALGVSQPAVSKALPALEKEGFIKIKKDKESKRLSIWLNREDQKVFWFKRVDNLKQIYESGLVEFIYEKFPGASVILFGSYAFGEDYASSDIDIAVVGSVERELDLLKFEKALERQINLNYSKSFADIDKHLLNNILNGITIKGSVEL